MTSPVTYQRSRVLYHMTTRAAAVNIAKNGLRVVFAHSKERCSYAMPGPGDVYYVGSHHHIFLSTAPWDEHRGFSSRARLVIPEDRVCIAVQVKGLSLLRSNYRPRFSRMSCNDIPAERIVGMWSTPTTRLLFLRGR